MPLTILIFFLILSVLVLAHELGHFLMAKIFGIYVEEFGFGLPPKIIGKKIGETTYSINALPIGGFVKLLGEEETDDIDKKIRNEKLENRTFYKRAKWQRAVVLTAGVVMNFLLAFVVISFIFTQGVFIQTDRVHIDKVIKNTPAFEAGIREGDIILTVNGKKIKTGEDLILLTKNNLGKEVKLDIERNSKEGQKENLVLTIVPRKEYPKDQGPMGVAISNLEERKYPWYLAPIYGMKEAIFMCVAMFKGLFLVLWNLVTFKELPKDVAGPVGIAQITGEAVKFGWMAVLQLLGLLSLNLAVINILPIPALDGGRLLFVVLESIIGRKVKAKVENAAHQVGMAFLLGLILLVTINDIMRVIRQSGIIK